MGFTAGRPRALSGYRPAVTPATIVRVEARGLKAVVIIRQMPAACTMYDTLKRNAHRVVVDLR